MTLPVDWDSLRNRLDEIAGRPGLFKPIFPTIGRVVEEDANLGRRLFDEIDRFEGTAVPSARLFPGALELLARLSEDAKVSLVTMQGRQTVARLLDVYGLKRFFLGYFTREDSLDRATQVEMALSIMKTEREDALFVGDRLNDLSAAKKAGVPFVLVRTHGTDPVEEDVPVYHSIAEFAKALGY